MMETELLSIRKLCSLCSISKLLKDFDSEKKGKFGRRGRCKICEAARHKKYRENNRIQMRVRNQLRYQNLSPEAKQTHIQKKSSGNQKRYNYEVRKRYNTSDRGVYLRYRSDAHRRSRNYEFQLTFEFFAQLINSACNFCGKENCRGVDRLDNNVGYINSNVVPCCKRCNEMKSVIPVQEWLGEMQRILKHQQIGVTL